MPVPGVGWFPVLPKDASSDVDRADVRTARATRLARPALLGLIRLTVAETARLGRLVTRQRRRLISRARFAFALRWPGTRPTGR
jgi:hypothetical protein